MAEPLSEDLRKRLLAAVEDGASRRAVADCFGVVASTVTKFVQHVKRTVLDAHAWGPGSRGPFAILNAHCADRVGGRVISSVGRAADS